MRKDAPDYRRLYEGSKLGGVITHESNTSACTRPPKVKQSIIVLPLTARAARSHSDALAEQIPGRLRTLMSCGTASALG